MTNAAVAPSQPRAEPVRQHILSPAQRRALEFLAKGPWSAAWWGGKPHGNWPKELNARAYDKLASLGFIGWEAKGAFDRTVKITPAGKAALSRPFGVRELRNNALNCLNN